jgi:hypothetical protein
MGFIMFQPIMENGKVIEYWTIFSLKINYNYNYREIGHPLGIIGKPSVSRV